MEKAVVTIDKKGLIRSANQCAVAMFGYTKPAELLGHNVSMLCPPPYKEQHNKYLQNYQQTGIPKVRPSLPGLQGRQPFFLKATAAGDWLQ